MVQTSPQLSDLEYLLNRAARKLGYQSHRTLQYVNKLFDVLDQLNHFPLSLLSMLPSHQFYRILRDLVRDLFIAWYSSQTLFKEDIDLLKKSIFFFHRCIDAVDDVTKLRSWLIESSFVHAFVKCLKNVDRLLTKEKGKSIFKQVIHLFDVFSTFYNRSSRKATEQNDLDPVFEGTIDCLLSVNYDRLFRRFKANAKSMTSKEEFFLIKCPSLICVYRGAQSQKMIELILETMIPRYALLLDQHIASIDQWNTPLIDAVHHLLLTVIYAKDSYGPYARGEPLRWLIDHLIHIIKAPSFIRCVNEKSSNHQTVLLDVALRTLTTFIHDPDLLVYMKNLKITSIFRSLTSLANESIVLHAYVMLTYTLDEDEIEASKKDAGRLLSKIFDSLRKKLRLLSSTPQQNDHLRREISLLIEALRALVQHDQIKSEILKQNAVSLLMDGYEHLNPDSKRLLLESLGSITFDQEAARSLRHNAQFLHSIEGIQSANDNGIQKAAENIMWNLTIEPEREKQITKKDLEEKEKASEKIDYQYDIMISYCHADKELVYRIHKFLSKKGFKIWFDRDNIYGPAIQAMAEAVEKSEFVLLCVSDSYKRSVYCQAEAEYAFRCKKHLLPCIVRQGYRADGWLGLVIGSRIYVEFGRLEFPQACELIVKEITLQRENQLITNQSMGKEKLLEKFEKSKLPNEYWHRNTTTAIYRSVSIEQWTRKDVLDYLYDLRLYHLMPICELMNGSGLMKLFRLSQKKPNRFYGQLNEELNKRFDGLNLPMGIFTQFLSEMDRFLQSTATQAIEQNISASKSLTPRSSYSSPPNPSSTRPSDQPLVQGDPPASSQQSTQPSLTTVRTSRNVQITEQTAYQIRSQ